MINKISAGEMVGFDHHIGTDWSASDHGSPSVTCSSLCEWHRNLFAEAEEEGLQYKCIVSDLTPPACNRGAGMQRLNKFLPV